MLEFVDENTVQRGCNGALSYHARPVRDFLTYQRRWIGKGGHIAWPPRSPNLTSPDFFLWLFEKHCLPDRTYQLT